MVMNTLQLCSNTPRKHLEWACYIIDDWKIIASWSSCLLSCTEFSPPSSPRLHTCMHSCTLCRFKTSIELVPDLLMKRAEDSSPSSFSPMFSSSILLQSGKGRILIIINKSKILRCITYCIRYCVKCLHILSHLILTVTLSSRCNSYPHFPEEATEAQTGGVTCLGSHSWESSQYQAPHPHRTRKAPELSRGPEAH